MSYMDREKLYPDVINPNSSSCSSFSPNFNSSSPQSKMYPSLDMSDIAENLFPDPDESLPSPNSSFPSAPKDHGAIEELLIRIPGSILHLIDKQYSVQLACGDFTIIRLIQKGNVVAVLACVGNEIQWPLTKDEAVVKLDGFHYFFSLCGMCNSKESDYVLNYGLTVVSNGQESLLKELDGVLECYSSFSSQKVSEVGRESEVLNDTVAHEAYNGDMKSKEYVEKKCAAYWTTLAPNVEDYGGMAAKLIATGSGQLIKGILWCGDVTVERLNWGNEVLMKKMPASNSEISPDTLKKIKRVKGMTKMTEKAANGVLSGVVKVTGFFTSSIANSKVGKKFFGLLPGEIVLASLDGFNKVCDAVEVTGRTVMSTSSTVTTGLVSHRYGEKAGEATNEGMDAAGHAIGTAWAVFKIRKGLNPKSVFKPSSLVKSAAKEINRGTDTKCK